jgi:4-hydroxybenzoate polyprenyltransferase
MDAFRRGSLSRCLPRIREVAGDSLTSGHDLCRCVLEPSNVWHVHQQQQFQGERRWYSGGHPFKTPLGDRGNDGKKEPRVAGPTSTTTSSIGSSYEKRFAPYMQLSRMDKPIGTWLLLWPSWWSICLASPTGGPIDIVTLGLFGGGAVLLRGAGCTVNDMWDKDFDKHVERTKNRPLASGALSQRQALGWLLFQLSGGLGILLQLPFTSQMIGVASLPFVVAYPLMKRITGWPQAFLGLTINWGAMMGWAAVCDQVDWGAVGPLYVSGFFWTLIYDTIYAHQDKHDDIKVGVKSTALTFGGRTKNYLAGFGLANIASLTTAGVMAGCREPFLLGVAAAGAHLTWQICTVDLNKQEDCMNKFKSNWWYGATVWAGIVADKFLRF